MIQCLSLVFHHMQANIHSRVHPRAHTRLPDGRNFANYNVDYMDDVQKPFGDWIVSLFREYSGY